MYDLETKRRHLAQLAEWRRRKYAEPELRNLFLELTLQCNEHCLHCGSRCGAGESPEVPSDILLGILADVKARLDTSRTMLCITGGEPLLRADFAELMERANALGYRWGMTTNGTLITRDVAQMLSDCGMSTVSVSVDGLAASHDAFRRRRGSHDAAIAGVENLLSVGGFNHVQVTTVVSKHNIEELDAMFAELDALDIDSWRLTAMEPMGRALEHPELMLEPDDIHRLMAFIRDKREDGWPLRYGCCHYLGVEWEREVRDFYFLCAAGIYIASIMANGDIGTCLDIDRRSETIWGNVYRDDFVDVWTGRFRELRREVASLDPKCAGCGEREFCAGGSWHSFDFDARSQRVCLKGVLF